MANIRIPVSKGAIGNNIKIPEVSGFLENVALNQALNELGKSLSKFSKNESIRSDRFLLASSNLEGIINSSISQTQGFEVYDAEGKINYDQSIQKINNVIESSTETWEQAKHIALQEVENLPWNTKEVKSSALATVASHFNATDSKSINKTLLAQSDNLKEQWIVSLLTDANYYPDVSMASVIDLVTNTAESMSKPSNAKATILNLTSKYIQNNSTTVPGATEILMGSENPILQSLFSTSERTAKNTLKEAIGISSENNKETTGSITAITLKSLEDLSVINANIPDDNKNKLWFEQQLFLAQRLFEVNLDVSIESNALITGQVTKIKHPKKVDVQLEANGEYDRLDFNKLMVIIESFAKSTETMPPNLANKLNQFISKPEYEEIEMNLFNGLADLYNKNGLKGLNEDSENKLQLYISNQHITERKDRFKIINSVENVKFTEDELAIVESIMRSSDDSAWFFDSQIEQLLEEEVPEGDRDWDELSKASMVHIARILNRSILNNAKIYKRSEGTLTNIDTNVILKKSLQQVINKLPIIKASNSQKSIVIPFELNIKDLNGDPAQISVENVLELYRHLTTDFVRKIEPTLSGEDLRKKVEDMLPDLFVSPNPMNLGTFSIRTEDGSDIGVLDPQLLVQDYFDPSAIILPDELLPGESSILPQGSSFSLQQKEAFTFWQYRQPTDQAIEDFPFKNQAAQVFASEEFKKLPKIDKFKILYEIGDSLIKQSSANVLLRSPEFLKVYAQTYENSIGESLNDSVLADAKKSDIINPENYDPNFIVYDQSDHSGLRRKLLETPWHAPRPQFVEKEIDTGSMVKEVYKLITGTKTEVFEGDGSNDWIYEIYDEAVEVYTTNIMNMSDEERRIVYNQANSTLLSSLDLSIEHFTPVGVLQGYERSKVIKDENRIDNFVKVFKSKIERRAEVEDPNSGSSIMQTLVPTEESIYRIIETDSNAILVKRMPTISRSDADEIQKAINDINGFDDIPRLQVMALVENDKQMQQIIAGMRNKRFNGFVKKLLKERVLGDGLQ